MSFTVEALGFVPVLALTYALATRRERSDNANLISLAAGLALIVAAFTTPLQDYALHTFLWAHLLQNVVLAEWAPALLVLAVPYRLAKRWQPNMFVTLPLWLGTYFVWHLPWIYDYALEHPHSLLLLEHATYLLAGIGLWWPIVHGRMRSGAKALYLFAAFVLASPIGLLLALIPKPIYDFYADAPRTWGPSPLTDQQLAGMTMAFEQAAVFFAVFTMYLSRFLGEEQLDPQELRERAERRDQRAVRGA